MFDLFCRKFNIVRNQTRVRREIMIPTDEKITLEKCYWEFGENGWYLSDYTGDVYINKHGKWLKTPTSFVKIKGDYLATYDEACHKLAKEFYDRGESPTFSRGICGLITAGYGELDDYGYFEYPLQVNQETLEIEID